MKNKIGTGIVFFTDLDSTLFQSKNSYLNAIFTIVTDKMRNNFDNIAKQNKLLVGAYSKKDKQTPATFISPQRQQLIKNIIDKQNNIFIPVTMRTKEEFDVINLDIYKKVDIPFVITDNGTRIFVNLPNITENIKNEKHYFVEDNEWKEHIENQKNNNYENLVSFYNELVSRIKNVQLSNNIDLYIKNDIYVWIKFINFTNANNSDDNKFDTDYIQSTLNVNSYSYTIKNIVDELDKNNEFYCHVAKNGIAIFPKFMSKKEAVSFLIRKTYLKEHMMIGMGDSTTDLSFMHLCHFSLYPNERGCQIYEQLNLKHL